jgi:phosphonate transport system ATP-binding protein
MSASPSVQPPVAPPAKRPEKPNPETPHVALRNLGLRRGDRWLFRGLTLDVPRGTFVAVVGPSGVGKSSLLACLAGMLPPTEGEVTYCCRRNGFHEPHTFQDQIGIVFQNLMLVPNSPVLANVLLGRLGRYPWWRTLLPWSRRDREAAYRLLVDLGLGEFPHRWVCETSGGEQQRTAIARALFQEPELYLADEPVSHLDVYLTGRVLGILRHEAQLRRRTVFCVLHNPELVERFADYALSLDPLKPEAWKLREVQAHHAHPALAPAIGHAPA